MDYDFITTCNWTATGTYTLRAYRGSNTNVVTTWYASIFYRKKGTSTWTALNSSGQMVVDSTGEWEVANDWNKSGNDCLTHSYYGITAINSCTSVEFNETSLGSTVGNYFLGYFFYGCSNLESFSNFNLPSNITTVGTHFIYSFCLGCTSLTSMPVGFNIPQGITTIGDSFMQQCWQSSGIVSMPSGFNLPSGITNAKNNFCSLCWFLCADLVSMPAGFNIPSGITSVGSNFFNQSWSGCTLLKSDGYTEDIDFDYDATNTFAGTCPITPDSPTAGSSVAVNRPPEPYVSTQACTDITGTSVTGNGNIVGIGNSTPTTRGFCYKAGTSGDPTTSDSKVYDTGTYSTGAFTKSITGLTAGTTYRVRAYAINSDGTGYGTTVSVTPTAASSFIPRTMWF